MQDKSLIYNGLFGLRLSHSLHLGHIVGNIRPAVCDLNKRTIIVVLADLFTYTSDRKNDITVENILSMTAESISLGLDTPKVKYVLQSQVFNNLLPLFTILSCLLRFNKLKTTKPISRMLSETKDLNFGELSFPIIQCAEMVSTNSEILYSNLDNLGVVSLTEYLYKKLGLYTNTSLPKPSISPGELKYVRGTNYNKMSQSNKNAIFIDDQPKSISKKIKSINTNTKDKEIDFELIYEYFKVFGYSDSDIDILQDDLIKNKTTPLKIKNQLSEEINNYLIPIKNKKKEVLQEREMLIDRINLDTQYVKQIVSNNIDCIFKNFYNKEFYKSFKI